MDMDELTNIAQQEQAKEAQYVHRARVCTATGCLSIGSEAVKEALEQHATAKGKQHCLVMGVGCMGLCGAGPLVSIDPANVLYQQVTADDATAIIDSLGDEPIERLRCDTSAPFFTRQLKIVNENSGIIDPEHIESYIAHDGYSALAKALTELSPNDLIHEITTSGLRGRGGAGYPTGLKWSTVAKTPNATKYVVCNGDEGDPGAFMDRNVMESDPHRVLEGMAIGAYAVGASYGYVYVRAEYPLAVERINKAIRQAEKNKLLGKNIFGTPFSFDVEVRLGAGAFVCGEETALMASIEGKRGTPHPRPPYPAESGLWGYPTLINNVETFANIAPIIRKGGDWFAGIGVGRSRGTKVFALSGKINNIGLIEVPMGISLHDIIYEIGGGIPDGRTFKAVQTGGPSGGCIPSEHLDVPVDYESLKALSSVMGSGGMIVMDDTSSMVDVARFFMEFCMSESCGKCIPCRVGTVQMHHILTKFSEYHGAQADLDLLERLCDMVKYTSLCGLGQSAPNAVVSTLRFFRDEYEARMSDTMSEMEGTHG
ncbi:MAG: NuoF family protein [Phototrophicales bacterium]|nr:NuoF family protein [Phototrophicales bacterium]